MNDEKRYNNIVERLQFMVENMEDLTIDEKIMQLKMVGADIAKLEDPMARREVLVELMEYAVYDMEAQVAFQIFYPKELEE